MTPERAKVTAQFFPRCNFYSVPSNKNRHIKYTACKLGLKISPDPKPTLTLNLYVTLALCLSLTLCYSCLVFIWQSGLTWKKMRSHFRSQWSHQGQLNTDF